MQTKKRELGGMVIEEPVLDEIGQAKQRAIGENAHLEYIEHGSLAGEKLREQVERYEREILSHVVD
ncbi:MAG: hypothetical protein Q4C13_05620 [Clostridia bacterium]|nr:hypothetical protein [Clostridia bacterium]